MTAKSIRKFFVRFARFFLELVQFAFLIGSYAALYVFQYYGHPLYAAYSFAPAVALTFYFGIRLGRRDLEKHQYETFRKFMGEYEIVVQKNPEPTTIKSVESIVKSHPSSPEESEPEESEDKSISHYGEPDSPV